MSEIAARIAAAAGDASALLVIAIELAQENAQLAQLREQDAERKRKQADRTYKSRNGVSRDVTLPDVTECDSTRPPLPSPSLLPPTPPNNSSPPSPPSSAEPAIVATSARISPPRADVELVVEHYRRLHPKRRPGGRDRTLIARHLATYSPAELCEALDGNATDEWACRTGKHELTWVLRDNGQIDTYRAKAEPPAVAAVQDGWMSAELERETRPRVARL